MIRLYGCLVGGSLGGIVLLAATAYVALMWFDCHSLIEDF